MTNPARTLLEQKIHDRRMTFEEFAGFAETFARENGQVGTLSVRHVQRLASGHPTGPPRPATRRLLEAIFGAPYEQLVQLSGTEQERAGETVDGADALATSIGNSRRVNSDVMRLLAEQIENIRQLDRRLGAVALLDQLRAHAAHIEQLLTHAVRAPLRRELAAVLTDAHTLAGWQSLDRGEITAAWTHYGRACDAARTAESPALLAHAQAEQAVILSDIGQSNSGVELTTEAAALAQHTAPPLLRSWLAAAHGEALAVSGHQDASLHAFDDAADLLPLDPTPEPDSPYVALSDAHLNRWRGHALARFGHPDAIMVLTDALTHHDPTFVRAETSLRADLAVAYVASSELDEAQRQRARAATLADEIGSVRQRRRLPAGQDRLFMDRSMNSGRSVQSPP